MKKHVRYDSAERRKNDVMSWMFELKHFGASHKSIYVVLSDRGGDFSEGRLRGNVSSSVIWSSIVKGVDTYLTRLIEEVKPEEYEIETRYYRVGVAKRESKGNELWTYIKEDSGGGRRNFQSPLTFQGFFT